MVVGYVYRMKELNLADYLTPTTGITPVSVDVRGIEETVVVLDALLNASDKVKLDNYMLENGFVFFRIDNPYAPIDYSPLIAPGGGLWRLKVDDDGVLYTERIS
jgi:hypothetical protein